MFFDKLRNVFSSEKRVIILIFFALFFLLVFKGMFFLYSTYGHHDAQVHIDIIKSLSNGEGFLSHAYHTSPALWQGVVGFIMYLPSMGIYWLAIIIQALYYSLSAVLLYLFLKRRGLQRWLGVLIFIAGFMVFSLESSWLMLEAPLILLLMLSLYFEKRPVLSSVFFALAILCKGFAAFLMLPIVLILYKDWKKRIKFLVIPLSVFFVWGFATSLIPGSFNQMVHTHYWRYSYLGVGGQDSWESTYDMVSDITAGIVTRPQVLFEHLITSKSFFYLVFFFGIAAFLPIILFFRKPVWILVFLPMLLALLMSSQDGMSRPFTQYHISMLPFVAWASVEALRHLRIKREHLGLIAMAGLVLVFPVSIIMGLLIFQPMSMDMLQCVETASGDVIAVEDGSRYLFFFTNSSVWLVHHNEKWANYTYESNGDWNITDLNEISWHIIHVDFVMTKEQIDIFERTPEAKIDYYEKCGVFDYKLYVLKES